MTIVAFFRRLLIALPNMTLLAGYFRVLALERKLGLVPVIEFDFAP